MGDRVLVTVEEKHGLLWSRAGHLTGRDFRALLQSNIYRDRYVGTAQIEIEIAIAIEIVKK